MFSKSSLFRLVFALCLLSFILAGCDSSSGSHDTEPSTGVPTPTPSLTPLPAPANAVTISGSLTFDYVPESNGGGLNYADTEPRAIRGAVVQAFDDAGQLHAQTSSNALGHYALRVGENINIAVRVLAEMNSAGLQSWHVSVNDNTQNNALYSMQGDFISSGEADSTRDLHASSGWSGQRYRTERVAAPFSILDAVYDAQLLIINAIPDIQLAPLQLRWSRNNIAVDGDKSQGEINTSLYDITEKHIYILGDENNDTDEYDRSVIQHEWSHYFDDNHSRSDSIGGAHDLNAASDMRLAYSEGFANAFSGIASGQNLYRDSSGIRQEGGFSFSLESNSLSNAGWFSENSIGKFVYDLVDQNNELGDALALDYANILDVITGDDYIENDALTSVYLFADRLSVALPEHSETIYTMLSREAITGRGKYGEGETNDSAANLRYVLPIYHSISAGDTVEVCGNNSSIEYNGFDNRRFLRFTITEEGNYFFSASLSLGTGERDPDMLIYQSGSRLYYLTSEPGDPDTINEESATVYLPAGAYILEVYDYLNIDGLPGGGTSCFDVSIFAQ